eukprot:7099556-Alexandrium_andersonii.AAC.1
MSASLVGSEMCIRDRRASGSRRRARARRGASSSRSSPHARAARPRWVSPGRRPRGSCARKPGHARVCNVDVYDVESTALCPLEGPGDPGGPESSDAGPGSGEAEEGREPK